jgi:acyl-CoA synthetase (AMP-forming)/AMP-acid ligase II/pimeloyl-ACP methyl ester carboxylesterase
VSRASRTAAGPATLPPAGMPGLDPAWSRLVQITDSDGYPRTFHVLDTHNPDSFDPSSGEQPEPAGTLLCVHGNPTWSYLWRRLLAAPPPGWRVIASDHLGMGYSERTGTPRVLEQRVDDLGRLTDALGVTGSGLTGPVVTVAHDWGGIISLGWAAEHRDQLRGVVLTNTAVHQPEDSKGPILIRLAHIGAVNRVVCRWTPLFVRATTSLTWPLLPADVRDAFAAPYGSIGRRAAVGDFVADIPFAASHPSRPALDVITDGIAGLAVPALLLWGPRDPVFLEEHLRDLQDRLPQAVLHRYEGASHLLPEDAPGYAAAVVDWVGGLATPITSGTPQPQASGDDGPTELAALAARADDHGDAVVEVSGRSISWAELHERVRDTAAGLAAAGVRPGDRVALLVPPSIELTVALYSVWQCGAVIVVVDKGLGLRGMGRALRSARVDHVIAETAGLLAAGPMRVPGSRIAAVDVPWAVRRAARVAHTIPELVRTGRDLPSPAEARPDDEAAVIFTSGATGPAKGVLYRHRQVRAQLTLIREAYGITGADRIVAAFAPFALYGPALGVPSAVPATDVTRPGALTAAALADAAAAVDATVVFASPAALTNVLATADRLTGEQRAALARVRLLMSAGAPVPAALLRRLTAVLPKAAMHTPYGMTEGLPLTDISLPEIEAAGDGDGVCVGRPLAGVELRIGPFDEAGIPGTELTARPGVSGEIWVRAAHLKDRYDSRWVLENTAAANPGWHRTGDVGMLDAAGRLWVQGRTVHVITTADGPVTPVGIEQRVQAGLGRSGAQPTRAAVVGVGPAGTQQVVVVLTGIDGPLAAPALATAARAAAGQDLAAVLVRKSLPVDIRHNSKIDRVAVGEWASELLSGKAAR